MSPPSFPSPTPTGAWGAQPPPSYGSPLGQPVGGLPEQRPGTNGFAVASLVLGIAAPCGGGLPSVIFGILALVQIKKSRQKGKGLAVGGLAATGVWVAAIVIAGTFAVLGNSVERDGSGNITQGGRVSIDDLAPGDCVNGLDGDGAQTSLPAVPCAELHEGEVYALFDVSQDAGWPGEDVIFAEADTGCLDRLAGYSRTARDDTVTFFYFHPTRISWQTGDREIICIAYFLDGRRTGSLAG